MSFKKLVALLLSIVLCVSLLGTTAFAKGGGGYGDEWTMAEAEKRYDRVETFDHVDIRVNGTITYKTYENGVETGSVTKNVTVSNPTITITPVSGTPYSRSFTNTTSYEWRWTGLHVNKTDTILLTCDITIDGVTKTGQTFSWAGKDAFVQAIFVCDGKQGLDFNVSAEDITNIFYYNVDYTWDNAPASAVLPADGNLYAPNATVNVDTTFAAGKQIDEGGYTYTFSGWTDYTPEGGSTTQLGGASSFTITADTVVHGAWTKESDSLSSETGAVLIPFVKSWDDEGAESYRPDSISVSLYRYTGSAFDAASAALVETKTVTAADGWSCTFDVTAQPLFDDNGNASKYQIVEGAVTQYEESGHTDPSVTFIKPSAGAGWNRITPCSELQITSSGTYKSVVVAKKGNVYVIWTADALTENERQVIFQSAKENITGFGQGNYENAVFFSGINGTARGMTVTADTIKFSAPSDWSFLATGLYSKSSTEANGAAITNRFVPPTKSVTVSKSWIDGDSANRPASISVQLLADGAAYGAPVTLTETGNWSYTWTDLPIYADGEEITYTVTEADVQGYTPGYGTDANGGLTITNKLDQVYTSISGTKTWIDPAGTVHPSVTINLLRNGEKIDEVVLPNGTTTYSFESLPLYSEDRDTTYTYTVTESAVDGYTSEQDGTNFTNTIEQEYISVSGTKTWIDPQGTVHPDVTINLLRDGEVIDNVTLQSGTTTYSFTDLDKYDLSDGHIYEYTVEEVAVEGYTSKQEGTDFINTIAQEQIDVAVTKTWADPAGTVHPDITINLLRDGQEIDEVVLQNGTTTHTFEKLDRYDLTDGHEYAYTVTEDSVDGYGTDVDGLTITNTIAQAYTSVSGTKTWIDPQGTEHPSIIINLLRDGEVIDEVELQNGETEYAFEELPVYSEDRLTEYTYTVEEEPVEGYSSKVEGTDIINTIEQEKIDISGTKTWIDPQGTEHPTITINLFRDGQKCWSLEMKNGDSRYVFPNLDKYDLADGHAYVYTVEEEAVDGYTSAQNGFDFTNTVAQKALDLTVTKVWKNADGVEHPTITVRLYRDGTEIDKAELKNGVTTFTFKGLDTYDLEDGHAYVYTVGEDKVSGYTSTIDGLTITNTKLKTPVTGDTAVFLPYVALMLLAGGSAVLLIRKKRVDEN